MPSSFFTFAHLRAAARSGFFYTFLKLVCDSCLSGVYISKTSYIREGEKTLDVCYRPFHVVEYYRYMRFFVDGKGA